MSSLLAADDNRGALSYPRPRAPANSAAVEQAGRQDDAHPPTPRSVGSYCFVEPLGGLAAGCPFRCGAAG